jgi:uncharacterized membrane protein
MQKFKNYGLWLTVSSLLFMVVQDSEIQITPEKWDVYVNSILGILVLLGIISNPSHGKGFSDKND